MSRPCPSCRTNGADYDHPQGLCDECAADPTDDHAPTYCRFYGRDICRANLDISEHNLTAQGWEHPTGLDARGYWAFGERAVNQ